MFKQGDLIPLPSHEGKLFILITQVKEFCDHSYVGIIVNQDRVAAHKNYIPFTFKQLLILKEIAGQEG